MAFLRPVKITHNLENNEVTDIAAGREHSIFVTRNKSIFIILVTDETEVFGSGHNLKGELGIGYLRHVADLIKIEGLSNF
jgi:alpha-tubulin suppressor-like RCC1 family protein